MKIGTILLAGMLPLTSSVALAQAAPGAAGQATASGSVAPAPSDSASMQKLQRSAQQLRESIQALARKPPGTERDRAIANAHEALLETQRAMIALPPELRTTQAAAGMGYDESVDRLMKAADSLRQSIQEMAQQPAGARRDRAIAEAHKALRDTQAAMLSAHQPASTRSMGAGEARQTSKAGGNASSRADGNASVLVLVPSSMAGDTRFANGCWVRFFDDKQFRGAALTLAGPVDMPKMEVPGGVWRDWDSAVVGPRARVTTYDNENYRDRTAELAANQSYPDLRDRKLGWFEEVKSARVACG
jgi:hypothetical protein